MKLRSLDDAMELRESTLNGLLEDRIDRHKARLLLQACRDHIHQMEASDLEDRVSLLDSVFDEYGLHGREFWKLLDHLADIREIRKERNC